MGTEPVPAAATQMALPPEAGRHCARLAARPWSVGWATRPLVAAASGPLMPPEATTGALLPMAVFSRVFFSTKLSLFFCLFDFFQNPPAKM